MRYSTQVDIPVFFLNGTNYDFNLIISKLAKEFRSEMKCIPLNTNKYMSFSIPITKEELIYESKKLPKKQDKPIEENEQNEPNKKDNPKNESIKKAQYKKPKKKIITYSLKFMDTARHNNRLSTMVDNLSELYMCNCEEDQDKNIKK